MKARIYRFPEWIRVGRRISVKSAVFGIVNGIITDVTDKAFAYQPIKHGRDYSCSVTCKHMREMELYGEIRPL